MKQTLAILSIISTTFAPPAFAQVATGTIQLPASFTSDILAQATNFLTSLGGYLTLIIGLLLALVAAEFLIGAFHRR